MCLCVCVRILVCMHILWIYRRLSDREGEKGKQEGDRERERETNSTSQKLQQCMVDYIERSIYINKRIVNASNRFSLSWDGFVFRQERVHVALHGMWNAYAYTYTYENMRSDTHTHTHASMPLSYLLHCISFFFLHRYQIENP